MLFFFFFKAGNLLFNRQTDRQGRQVVWMRMIMMEIDDTRLAIETEKWRGVAWQMGVFLRATATCKLAIDNSTEGVLSDLQLCPLSSSSSLLFFTC